MKNKFKFKMSPELDRESFGYETGDIYTAVRHPEADDLYIVTWKDNTRDEGWDSVVYEEETIKENIDDGSWILIEEENK